MLEIKNVTISYGDRPTVKKFSMTLKKGEIASIVGESGSGKTTVIRAVLGLLPGGGKVTEGDILFEGKSLLDNTAEEWRNLRGTDMSMIFQDSGAMLNPIRKIGSVFVEYIRTHEKISRKAAWEKGREMLEQMRLPSSDNIMKSYPFQLSGGMRQRVGIAMAMTFQPKLLLADEPTSALDVTVQKQVVEELKLMRAEYHTAMIVVTHNIGVVRAMADQVLVLQNGTVMDYGETERVLRHSENPYTRKLMSSVLHLKRA